MKNSNKHASHKKYELWYHLYNEEWKLDGVYSSEETSSKADEWLQTQGVSGVRFSEVKD